MIDLTPVDVRKKKGDFRRTMRGYDPELVDDFLDLVADRLDQLVRESIALNERAVRQDREIAEYRERERALTEALVSAQEMREEIRKQTSREAEVIRQEAEELRSTTQREVAELRASAEAEVARMRAAAEEEASKLRSVAEQDTVELRTTVREEREREEEAVRRLRQRQQELLEGYRSLLEGELADLGVLAGRLGLSAAAAAAAMAAAEPGRVEPESQREPEPIPEPEPEPEPASEEAGSGFAGAEAGDDGAVGTGGTAAPLAIEPIRAVSAEDQLYGDLSGPTPPSFAHAEGAAEVHESEPSFEDDGTDLGVVDGLDLFEPEPLEPFAPEPFEPADETGDGLELYEGIAPDADHGVPGPIGLPPAADAEAPAWPPAADWQVEDLELTDDDSDAQRELAALGEVPADAESDADTLLRNAAEAGYRLPEDDDELLLLEEEAVTDEDGEPGDGEGWLGTLLDDDR
ncbi:MAG TPA: DivIVA domain-containing protein [Longimicrobiales bacterium]|nr:DivIVA domain-containing protein [Longimicrobiales bacterium]